MRIRVSHEIVHRFSPPARTVNQILRLTPLSLRQPVRAALADRRRRRRRAARRPRTRMATPSRPTPTTASSSAWRSGPRARSRPATPRAWSAAPSNGCRRRCICARARSPMSTGRCAASPPRRRKAQPIRSTSMHRLMNALHEALPYHPDEKDAAGSAIEAFALRRGRARDFAHIFIACARSRGSGALRLRLSRRRKDAGGGGRA